MVAFANTPRLTGRDKLVAESMFILKKTAGPGLCLVAGCKKKHVDRKRCGGILLCARHYQQRWRAQNPKIAAFRALKDHARSRRIPFTLTFARFKEITDESGYWDQQPETDADRLSVDRIDIAGPYSDDNVRIITKGANSAAGNRERWLPDTVKAILARRRGEQPKEAWHMRGAREDSWLESETPF